MKHLSLDLIRCTEKAAIQSAKLIGSGKKEEIDRVATEAIQHRLNQLDFAGRIAISEGEKDGSFYLKTGELVGKYGPLYASEYTSAGSVGEYIVGLNSKPKLFEIALDAVDGTTQTAIGGTEAMSVLALAEENSMYSTPHHYMLKLIYGQHLRKLGIDFTIDNANRIPWMLDDMCSRLRFASGKLNRHLTICLLNRERNQAYIDAFRLANCRIKLIQDCDVSAGIAACKPDSGIDLFFGIGGAPEAVLTAAAVKCLNGVMLARVVENKKTWNFKNDTLSAHQLIKGNCVFVATGILNGSLLKGVRFTEDVPITHSVFMRSESGTIRFVETKHGN